MDKLNLAPLTPFGTPPTLITNTTNPGCTNPADQSFAPIPTDRAISRAQCSSPTITSNGEMQQKNQHLGNVTSGTVTVSPGSSAVVQAHGGDSQFLDLRKATMAAPTGKGLPKNIYAGNKSHARLIPPAIAVGTPPAIDVAAGSHHPGNLPTNVNIR